MRRSNYATTCRPGQALWRRGYNETNQATPYNTYLRDANGNPVSTGTLGINGQKVTLTEGAFATSAPLNQGSLRYYGGFEGILGQDYKLKLELAKSDKTSWYNAISTGTWSNGPGTFNESPNDSLDGLAQISFPLGANQFLVTGVSVRKASVDRKTYILSSWRNPDSKTSLSDGAAGDSTTVSVFAQDEIAVSDALTVYVGGRLDRWETARQQLQDRYRRLQQHLREPLRNRVQPKTLGGVQAG